MHFISGILLQTRNLLLEKKYLSCDFFPHSPTVFITDTVISVHTRKKTICFESSDLFDLCMKPRGPGQSQQEILCAQKHQHQCMVVCSWHCVYVLASLGWRERGNSFLALFYFFF